MSENIITIDLLRHGEVAAAGWAFRGSTDIALSDKGWQQMRAVASQMQGETFSQIATSPLQRCSDFSDEMAGELSVSLARLDDMREIDFGDWENRGFDELEAEHGELLRRFWVSPVGIQPPGGEAFDDFVQRVTTAWQAWLADADGEHRLLVAHGGVIRVLLAHTLDMPLAAMWRLHLPYASWSRITLCEGHQPRVLFINRAAE